MAQYVGYWDNHIKYKEGPFVICGGPLPLASRGRIEAEVRGYHTSMVPHSSILTLIKPLRSRMSMPEIVDWLNAEAQAGRIRCGDDGVWRAPPGAPKGDTSEPDQR
jgi:hypothetical protein